MVSKTTNNGWFKLGDNQVLEPGKFNSTLDDIDTALGAVVSGAQALTAINAADASLDITGLSAAQGGSVTVTGGTSTTTSNAGGAVTIAGGVGTTTSVGGLVSMTGGAGAGASAGGAATVAGGLGGATNATGGVATMTAGAGNGTGNGAAASVIGGASGGGSTGNGGDAKLTGGAAASTAGNGGNAIVTGGANTSTGMRGSAIARGKQFVRPQGAPTAKTSTAAITAAELATGIITTTGVTAPSVHQLPTGTLLLAEFPGLAAGDAFDFHLINTGTGASDDATITVNTDVTIVGSPTVGALTDATIISGSGHFRARYTGGVTFIVYRLA